MATQIFDDGSTLTYDDWGNVAATPSTDVFSIDRFDAAKLDPYVPGGASGSPWWNRIFDYSIPRVIDSAIGGYERASNRTNAYMAAANGRTVPVGVTGAGLFGGGSMLPLLLLVGLVFVLAKK